MKKASLLILLIIIVFGQALAQNDLRVQEALARKTAQAFVSTQPTLKGQILSLVASDGNYIYDIGDHGFVIIAGSPVLPPVLAWSDQDIFPGLDGAPDNYASWIRHYSEMIDYAEANGVAPEAKIHTGTKTASSTNTVQKPLATAGAAGAAVPAAMLTPAAWPPPWHR